VTQAYQALPQQQATDDGAIAKPSKEWVQPAWLNRVETKGVAVKVWGSTEGSAV